MVMDEQYSIIKTRQNQSISEKRYIWDLIQDSYIGGEQYVKSNNLWQYRTESDSDFQNRKRRAVFFNHTQPAADMLTGFLYSNKPERTIQGQLDFLNIDSGKKQTFEQFMQKVATQSLLYTVGVLVDSPSFEENEVITMADRVGNNLNPYCVLYNYNRIRDFYTNDKGELEWILLDNSYNDNSNPFVPTQKVQIYTLWTRDRAIEFNIDSEITTIQKEYEHNLGSAFRI